MKTIKALKTIFLTAIVAILLFFASSNEANAGPRVRLYVGVPAPVVFVRARPHYVWYPGHYRYFSHRHRVWVRGYWRRCY